MFLQNSQGLPTKTPDYGLFERNSRWHGFCIIFVPTTFEDLTGSLKLLVEGAHNTETRTMQDNLRLSRLAYPRATLITVISLSLLILSVGLFADTSTEPLAMAELLANNGLLKQLTSTFS